MDNVLNFQMKEAGYRQSQHEVIYTLRDRHGRVLDANPPAYQALGFDSHKDFIGTALSEWPDYHQRRRLLAGFADLQEQGAKNVNHWVNVQGFWALLNVDSKITSKSGEASSMLVDITQYSPHKKWAGRIDYPAKRLYLTDDRKGEFLTGKEFGVLQLGIHGFSTRQISTYTGRSEKTVEKRRASVAHKLTEDGNRNAMWRQAAKTGLTEFLAADVDWLNMRETKAKK